MFVLGIKPSFGENPSRGTEEFWTYGGHDAAVCLLDDGELASAIEEERLSRVKHATNSFPRNSIQRVLEEVGIGLSDVEYISIGRDPRNNIEFILEEPELYMPSTPFDKNILNISALVAGYNGRIYRDVDRQIEKIFDESFTGEYLTVPHHRCHAATTFYCSDFDREIALTVDGRGEHDGTVLWTPEFDRDKTFMYYNSVGRFYEWVGKYLGFRWQDAGKVMGLAAYGEYTEEYAETFDQLVEYGGGEYDVTAITAREDFITFLEDHFGPRRVYPEPLTQRHKDIAYHLQLKTEEIVKHLVRHQIDRTGVANVGLSGGVAMNCKMNKRIQEMDCVDGLFVQPAANDAGIALGAALEGYYRASGRKPSIEFDNVYFGTSYSDQQIRSTLDQAQLSYEKSDDISERTAELLANGNIAGWFQGRMEYGARALGNRSILANPTDVSYRDDVNEKIKQRESWRPFAPSMLYEAREEYLGDGIESPFMILTDSVPESKHDEIPAVVHVDGTTRPQTVRKSVNERYYALIEAFEDRTGVPVVLNTSFNVAGEPIVESPRQAIQDFFTTGLDALVIGDYLLKK